MSGTAQNESIFARHYDALYDALRTPVGDVAFYRQLAVDSGGPVLELGCGTGRILLPIAKAGVSCIGVDPSEPMLAMLRAKSPPSCLELACQPMETIEFGDRRFPLVTAPFRSLSHLLDVETQIATLQRIRRHMAPGGLFAFDLFDPKLERLAIVDEPEALAATFLEEGIETRCYHAVRRDHARQLMRVHIRFDGGPPGSEGATEFDLRWYHRFEVEHLLARSGFRAVRFFGGFDRRPWSAGGETVVLAS
jgi:SAM-dependent methyltransferase